MVHPWLIGSSCPASLRPSYLDAVNVCMVSNSPLCLMRSAPVCLELQAAYWPCAVNYMTPGSYTTPT